MKNFKLIALFIKNSLLIDLEYRVHFIVNVFLGVFWITFSLLTLKLFFYHRSNIGGWNYYESMLVLGMFSFFSAFIEGILEPNVSKLVEDIRFGHFDFVLLKPVNSQVFGTLRSFSIKKFPAMFAGLAVCVYALVHLQYLPSVGDICLFLVFFSSALVILYSLWVMLITTAFWFVQVDSIMEFVFAIFETGRFPVTVYPAPLRFLFTFIIPIAFITTFPSAAIIGKINVYYAAMAILVAGMVYFVSTMFWKYALTKYSSASS